MYFSSDIFLLILFIEIYHTPTPQFLSYNSPTLNADIIPCGYNTTRRNRGAFPFYLRATLKNKLRLSTPRVPKGLKAGFRAYVVPKHQFADGTYGGGYCGGVTLPSPQFRRVLAIRPAEASLSRISVCTVCVCVPVIISVAAAIRYAIDTPGSTKKEVHVVFDVGSIFSPSH